jgi:fatty-acyl-CoA synthase
MILNHPEFESYAKYLKGWKVVIGGAALPKGLAKKSELYGIETIGGYGLSETCPVLSIALFTNKIKTMKYEDKFEYKISTGIPIPFVNLKVIDSAGKDVLWNNLSLGEIVVRAPWLTTEYYKEPERTSELWRDCWLHTGDLAVIDPMGYIHILDREKEAVKSGGEFIPTIVLENVISECKGVGEVAVVGVPHEKWGERPVAFLTTVSDLKEEDIFKHLEKYVEVGRIQKWWIPDKIIFMSSLPKTSTGKIDKKELRKGYK